jgi:hypothetical protein
VLVHPIYAPLGFKTACKTLKKKARRETSAVRVARSCHYAKPSHIVWLLRSSVCVTGRWAGVDNAWEQENPEARKLLENEYESHLSCACFVGRPLLRDVSKLNQMRATKSNLTVAFYPLG